MSAKIKPPWQMKAIDEMKILQDKKSSKMILFIPLGTKTAKQARQRIAELFKYISDNDLMPTWKGKCFEDFVK